MTLGDELLDALEANYFEGPRFQVRHGIDEAGVPWIVVLARRDDAAVRLFGFRFLDYPSSPPTLRFWHVRRWNELAFEFDFTSNGDDGSGVTMSPQGVATICLPFHVDYYRGGWHNDRPWRASEADVCLAELVEAMLRRI